MHFDPSTLRPFDKLRAGRLRAGRLRAGRLRAGRLRVTLRYKLAKKIIAPNGLTVTYKFIRIMS